MKRVFYILFILFAIGFAYYLYDFWENIAIEQSERKEQAPELSQLLENVVEDLQSSTNTTEDAMQLALSGIDLSQGTDGQELWRLKAQWATFSQDNGNIDVRQPNIQYLIGNDPKEEDYVYVVGEQGKIFDNQRAVSLKNDIVATREDMVLTSTYLEFHTDNRILSFPHGALVSSPKAVGKADKIFWDLGNNTLSAQDNVVFIFNNDNLTFNLDRE